MHDDGLYLPDHANLFLEDVSTVAEGVAEIGQPSFPPKKS